ncbi:MAG: DUF4350 domain-containing protein [Planctomycetota bacterium]|nr:DUF4350 domain-containing protein [Planctomycetota bacterium]
MDPTRRARWKTEWLWIALVGLAILLGFWWIPGQTGIRSDSYSPAGDGKKAFFTLARELLPEVARSVTPVSEALENVGTFCVLGPARPPDRREWAVLHDWVRRGGALLYAASAAGGSVDMAPFDVKVESTTGLAVLGFEIPDDDESDDDESDDDDNNGWAFWKKAEDVDTVLARGRVRWLSSATLEFPEERADVLLSRGEEPQVVRLSVGRGVLVVSASDRVFTNRELAHGDFRHGLLAFRILESCGEASPLVFDEYLNSSMPKVVGILFDPLFRGFTLQLIICALLFGWWKARRFGPASPSGETPRRSIREHAQALGNLHFKAGSGSHVISTYLEFFRREVGLPLAAARKKTGSRSDPYREPSEKLARGTGLEPRAIAKVLARADRAVGKRRLASGETAMLIRSLASIKKRLEHSKGARDGA